MGPSIMKSQTYLKSLSGCFFSLFFLLLFFSAPLQGAQFEEDVSTQDYLFVEGIIRSISPENQMIKIKQRKGPTISVFIDENTIFEGFYKLTELQPRQKIKVWYQPAQTNNRALKILKPLELGC
jgi:hypothetical protein